MKIVSNDKDDRPLIVFDLVFRWISNFPWIGVTPISNHHYNEYILSVIWCAYLSIFCCRKCCVSLRPPTLYLWRFSGIRATTARHSCTEAARLHEMTRNEKDEIIADKTPLNFHQKKIFVHSSMFCLVKCFIPMMKLSKPPNWRARKLCVAILSSYKNTHTYAQYTLSWRIYNLQLQWISGCVKFETFIHRCIVVVVVVVCYRIKKKGICVTGDCLSCIFSFVGQFHYYFWLSSRWHTPEKFIVIGIQPGHLAWWRKRDNLMVYYLHELK